MSGRIQVKVLSLAKQSEVLATWLVSLHVSSQLGWSSCGPLYLGASARVCQNSYLVCSTHITCLAFVNV